MNRTHPFHVILALCLYVLCPNTRGARTRCRQRENRCDHYQESFRVHEEKRNKRGGKRMERQFVAGLIIVPRTSKYVLSLSNLYQSSPQPEIPDYIVDLLSYKTNERHSSSAVSFRSGKVLRMRILDHDRVKRNAVFVQVARAERLSALSTTHPSPHRSSPSLICFHFNP